MNFWSNAWYARRPWLYLLAPFSVCYRGIVELRRWGYRRGVCRVTHFPLPVIVIGNVTVGGTGKTPLVLAIAQFLRAEGFSPGIVSRGYGGSATKTPQWVTADSDPAKVGDEAVLLAQYSHCPMVVCQNRVLAVRQLLAQSHCDVVLSDDGLQHYALGRSLEIAVVDGQRRFGNGWCLPMGPLRESLSRLSEVNLLVIQGGTDRPLTLPLDIPAFNMTLQAGDIYNLSDPSRILLPHDVSGSIHAVAGIGNPDRFFKQLRDLGFEVIEHPFADHHPYQAHELEFGADSIVIMTEKDAVKCRPFQDPRHWCLPIQAICDSGLLKTLKLHVKTN